MGSPAVSNRAGGASGPGTEQARVGAGDPILNLRRDRAQQR